MNATFPTFEEATKRLKSFLNDEGWPTAFVWVEQSNIQPISYDSVQLLVTKPYDKNTAKSDYDNAVKIGLGVAFEGLATTDDQSYVAVTWPKDQEESENLMYCETDLKLSLRCPRPTLA